MVFGSVIGAVSGPRPIRVPASARARVRAPAPVLAGAASPRPTATAQTTRSSFPVSAPDLRLTGASPPSAPTSMAPSSLAT